jgi:hypothetical protein
MSNITVIASLQTMLEFITYDPFYDSVDGFSTLFQVGFVVEKVMEIVLEALIEIARPVKTTYFLVRASSANIP